MRSKISNVLWGLFFIVLGVGFAGNAFNAWDFNLFFAGWWTLFIIVPCAISIIQNGPNTGSIIGLSIGIMLLLAQQDVFDMEIVGKLIFPLILVVIGLSIMSSNIFHKHKNIDFTNLASGALEYTATFSGQKVNVDNEPFKGATLNAVFGGIDLRLDHAIITEDAVINCSAVFGGIDIYVPSDVNVKVTSTPIFGGVDNKHRGPSIPDAPTIYINATCMFGGVDIR
jgi:predicted membrane protein